MKSANSSCRHSTANPTQMASSQKPHPYLRWMKRIFKRGSSGGGGARQLALLLGVGVAKACVVIVCVPAPEAKQAGQARSPQVDDQQDELGMLAPSRSSPLTR